MSNLQPGDIVKLNSGGPALTVKSVYGSPADPTVKVSWFNDEGATSETSFFASMVTPRDISGRPPIIPNPSESYEAAALRHFNRQTRE